MCPLADLRGAGVAATLAVDSVVAPVAEKKAPSGAVERVVAAALGMSCLPLYSLLATPVFPLALTHTRSYRDRLKKYR